jgi:hypothetical protein
MLRNINGKGEGREMMGQGTHERSLWFMTQPIKESKQSAMAWESTMNQQLSGGEGGSNKSTMKKF